MWTQVINFCRDEEGATAIEYGLIASLVSVAAVTAFVHLGNTLNSMFTSVANQLQAVTP